MDSLEVLELLGYFTAFWAFLFSPGYRRRQIAEFREAGAIRRCGIALEGSVATFCGLLPFLVLVWVQA